jgi:uncharacterized membrane protein HdeD (DUF308 family)
MSQFDVGPSMPGPEDTKELRRRWGWILVLGVVLLILGLVAIGHVLTATVIVVFLYGWLLVISGALETAYAIWARRWSGFFLLLLDGVLSLFLGILLLRFPVEGIAILTFILAIFFLIGGTLRLLTSLVWALPHRVWQFLSGLVAVGLGAYVLVQWPWDSWWFPGLFVGVELAVNGWSLIMLALVARRFLSTPA